MSATSAVAPSSLASNPSHSTEVISRYCRLFRDYRLAVHGAHFTDRAISGQPLWEWQGPPGLEHFFASARPPLLTFLAAQRLPPDLAKYLDPPQQQQQQQQQPNTQQPE